MNSSYTLINA